MSRPACLAILSVLAGCRGDPPDAAPVLDRSENAIWLRRHWIHGGPEVEGREPVLVDALVRAARSKGITRLYPFLGPMDASGHPGWRDQGFIRHYELERARAFFSAVHAGDPSLRVLPWTGGTWPGDVKLDDADRIRGFLDHVSLLAGAGADGIQLNVEPLPSGTEGFLALLVATKAALGPERTLSVAAYPPPTLLHPFPDVHWELDFLGEVCRAADELAIMAYDTALQQRFLYRDLVARWTRDLAETLPPRTEGGCDWLVGLPAYEDDVAWHRPDVETVDEAIRGVRTALAGGAPENFRGVAIYASWTTDGDEWARYRELWRGGAGTDEPFPDFPPDE